MAERKYLPTLAELIDRLSIVQLKMIFIPENREAYALERMNIEHDIDKLLFECSAAANPGKPLSPKIGSQDIRAIMMIMLANRTIWQNEAAIRNADESGIELGATQHERLRFTHSLNGVRNTAKNIIASHFGERVDLKVDCLAADLPADLGYWQVF
jgi:hypothetical protein